MECAGLSIRVRDVVCRFGTKTALDGVDLSVGAGSIHALLGPNGAGKTTLIRVLSGLVEPSAGSVSRAGTVGLVPSGDRSFYLRISALENLVFFARLHGLRLREAKRRAREMLEQVGLAEVAGRPVGRCSHGMQKRLGMARALLVEPQILLVDEATHDLDPEGARRIQQLVSDLARGGMAVVWTTQRVEEVRGFADSMTLLREGTVRFSGSPSEFAARAPVSRYIIRVRSAGAAAPPALAALQLAVGAAGEITAATAADDEFVLTPTRVGDLGLAVARLVEAGLEVVTCRHEQSELEEAFLHLASRAAA